METKKYDVVALGELLIDFTENGISSQGNPILEANPGGAPCNVLSMLQKFGNKTAFIGKVGEDNFGQMLKESLIEQGIDVSGLLLDKIVPTTLAFVHTSADGDRSFSFYRNPGADVMLTEDEVPVELIMQSKLFHFGTLSMTDFGIEKATKKAVEVACDNGLIISFDPNLRPPLWRNLDDAKEKMAYGFSKCDVLKISDDEILFFTGESDIEKGVNKIREQFQIKLICATLGKHGSIAYYDDKVVKCEPFINENTIETTGAGDTFMGCILHSILNVGLNNYSEDSLYEMLCEANAAASLITTKRGALKVMPQEAEIDAFRKKTNR